MAETDTTNTAGTTNTTDNTDTTAITTEAAQDTTATPLITDTNEEKDGTDNNTTTTTTTTIEDTIHFSQWHYAPYDCCSGGILPLFCCCLFPCYNYCRSMIIMDSSKDPLIECLKSGFCCCCMQRNEMRNYYNIDGFEIEDCLCSVFCYSCVGIQMLSEAKIRNGLQHAPLTPQSRPPIHAAPKPIPHGPGPHGPQPRAVHRPAPGPIGGPIGGPGPRGGLGGPGGPGGPGRGGPGGRGGRGGGGRGRGH